MDTTTYDDLPAAAQQYIAGLQAAHETKSQQLESMLLAYRSTKAPKLPDPRPYDGARNTRSLKDFLYDLQQHFKNEPAKFASDATKIMFASAYLKGTAKLWFQGLDETGKAPWTTYEEFTEQLNNSFAELDPLSYWLRKWDTLQQKGSVNHYLAEFSIVAAQLDQTEQAKYHHFKKGLRANVQDQLALLPKPESFNDLVKLANQIDSRFYEHNRERNQRQAPAEQKSTIQQILPPRNNRHSGPAPRPFNNNRTATTYASVVSAPTRPSWATDTQMQLDNMQRNGHDHTSGQNSHSGNQRSNRGSQYSNNGNRSGQGTVLVCYNCQKPGHLARDCFAPRVNKSFPQQGKE